MADKLLFGLAALAIGYFVKKNPNSTFSNIVKSTCKTVKKVSNQVKEYKYQYQEKDTGELIFIGKNLGNSTEDSFKKTAIKMILKERGIIKESTEEVGISDPPEED